MFYFKNLTKIIWLLKKKIDDLSIDVYSVKKYLKYIWKSLKVKI